MKGSHELAVLKVGDVDQDVSFESSPDRDRHPLPPTAGLRVRCSHTVTSEASGTAAARFDAASEAETCPC
jgi:hypothetical protein